MAEDLRSSSDKNYLTKAEFLELRATYLEKVKAVTPEIRGRHQQFVMREKRGSSVTEVRDFVPPSIDTVFEFPNCEIPQFGRKIVPLTSAYTGYINLDETVPNEDLLISFVIKFIEEEVFHSREDVTVWGQDIAKQGENYCPLNIFSDYGTLGNIPGGNLKKDTEPEDVDGKKGKVRGLMGWIVSRFRVQSIQTEEATVAYKKSIATRLAKLFQCKPYIKPTWSESWISSTEDNWAAIMSGVALSKLMGALNMALLHEPEHVVKVLRAGTLVTNLNDCIVWSDLAFAEKKIGVDLLSLLGTIYLPDFWDEARRITINIPQFNSTFSYGRYMRTLNVVSKSPYSATANPVTHLFIHFAGAFSGATRSCMARVQNNQPCRIIMQNAAFSVKIKGLNQKKFTQQVFKDDSERAEADLLDSKKEDEDEEIPDGGEDSEINLYVKESTKNLILFREAMKDGSIDRWISEYGAWVGDLTGLREGTVGKEIVRELTRIRTTRF